MQMGRSLTSINIEADLFNEEYMAESKSVQQLKERELCIKAD